MNCIHIMNSFTIKDLENLSGIKAHTIRIWEQRYSFLKPQRTETNIRYYTNDELRKILNIALLNKYGYKISHINRMNIEEIKEKILSLATAEAYQERIINDLLDYMVVLNLEDFERIIDGYILKHGIEKTIANIIFPFLEKIGILWLTNHINPAQEHLVSNIIRQKLIMGIEKSESYININKTLLLFLPEGEHHELGLLFMHYLLKIRGFKVLYVGADIPLKDLQFVVETKKPDLLYTHLTSVASNFNFDKFLVSIHARFPKNQLLISGRFARSYKKKLPSGIFFKKTLQEVVEHVSAL
jgi:MerR family transcriptional regulator, light-induced transcriptional regulator